MFHKHDIQPDQTLPRYLDLGMYTKADGVPYTQSSNLLRALVKAVSHIISQQENHYGAIQQRFVRIREAIEKIGYQILAQDVHASPGILTLVLKEGESALQLGDDLFLNGYRTHYESTYLKERNWLQVATMNEMTDDEIKRFLLVLERLTSFNRSLSGNHRNI